MNGMCVLVSTLAWLIRVAALFVLNEQTAATVPNATDISSHAA